MTGRVALEERRRRQFEAASSPAEFNALLEVWRAEDDAAALRAAAEDDWLARRVDALERTLQPNGRFLDGLLDAIGQAIGKNNAALRKSLDYRDDRIASLDARLSALEVWSSANIKAIVQKPRVRIAAASRRY